MTAAGVALVNAGREMDALPWYAAALRLAIGQRDAETSLRVRIEEIVRWLPKAEQVFPGSVPPTQYIFNPDGRHVAIARGNIATIFSTETGARTAGPFDHEHEIIRLAFTPHGTRLLTAGWGFAAELWDTSGNGLVKTFPTREPIAFACLSPDGNRVVTCGNTGNVVVWRVDTGSKEYAVNHKGRVPYAAFSKDGSLLGTASNDGTAKVWNAKDGRAVATHNHKGPVHFLAFSDRGERVASVNGPTCLVWDAKSADLLCKPLVMADWIDLARFTADGEWVDTVTDRHQLVTWDVATSAASFHQRRRDQPRL